MIKTFYNHWILIILCSYNISIMPESVVKQIGYFNWKGRTFGQISASLKKNQNTITDKNNIFRAGPLPLYRKEIASITSPTGNPRVSASVDEFNRPNGYIIRESESCCGADHTVDMTIPNSKYETGGAVELSGYADICFSQAENAKRRLRGSGVIKKNNQGNLTDEGILQFLYNGSFIFNGNTFSMDENQTMCTLAGIITYQGTYEGQSTYIWIPKYDYIAKTLIVGGGAGGGFDVGGGGGAGGVIYNDRFHVDSGDEYIIVVGAGSNGGISDGDSNGYNSSINNIIAYGGGSENTTTTNVGSAAGTLDSTGNTTLNTTQGSYGSRGDNWKAGGGGGGAGGPGGTGENTGDYRGLGGNGGDGVYYSISGTSTLYAAGGAGGAGGGGANITGNSYTGDDGLGGTSAGGGDGGGFESYNSQSNNYVYRNGSHATAYGSGGGGGGYGKNGGNGKEGIVIFTVTYSVVSARKSNYYTSNAQLLKERNKTYQQNQYKYDKSTFVVSDVHIDAPTQKLNNSRFYQQGGASASDLVSRKKLEEINNAASKTRTAYGNETADAMAYGIANQVYTKKDKVGFPLTSTPVISKYTGEIQAKCTGSIRRG